MPKSLKQVLDQIAKLEKEAATLRSKEVGGVVARIREAIAHYGLTPEELFGASPKKRAGAKGAGKSAGRKPAAKQPKTLRAAKYKDEAGNSWSGMGKRPNWFKDALAAGKTADDLLIRD